MSDEPAVAARKKRTRPFATKRKHALTQSRALAHRLQHALSGPAPSRANLAADTHGLVATIRSLRKQVLADGAGRHTKLVASGLADLATAVAKLGSANATTDPAHAIEIAAQGAAALQRAYAKAKAAGHDWPL